MTRSISSNKLDYIKNELYFFTAQAELETNEKKVEEKITSFYIFVSFRTLVTALKSCIPLIKRIFQHQSKLTQIQ